MELVGHISYCLQPLRGRKRRRGESPPAEAADGEDDVPVIGFLFHEQRGGDDADASGLYLLAAPQSLMREVCGAAHHGNRVRLRRYARVPLVGHPRIHDMLELHAGGLVVEPRGNGIRNASANHRQELVLTLHQLHRLETVDRLTGYKTPTYTFRATVRAVSPIFTFDPTDPCSLMELYEESPTAAAGGGGTACSCVAVLRRASLGFHAALRPGQRLTLRAVRRQAWAIPAALRQKGLPHLSRRLPDRVFVVDGPDQLEWDPPCGAPDGEDEASSQESSAGTCLTGRVVSVHLTVSDAGTVGIRYISLDRPDGTRCRLFLTYFPLPSDLQQALRPGAVVEAHQLHRIGPADIDYGACVRSSLFVRTMASEANAGGASCDDGSQRSLRHLQPCAFLPVDRTYAEWTCRQELDELLRSLNDCANHEEAASKDAWMARLLGPEAMKTYPRIAYAEFFDHDVSEGDGTTRNCNGISDDDKCTIDNGEWGCHLSWYNRLRQPLSCIRSLKSVQLKSMALAKSCLDAFLRRAALDGFQTGWTGSSLLLPDELVGGSAGGGGGSLLYTGGIFEPCSLPVCSQLQLGTISDKHTALPLTIRSSCRQVVQREPFLALIRVLHVRVSFVYIGADVPGDAANLNGAMRRQEDCTLPPLFSSRSTNGSSTIVYHSGHIFMVSLRLETDDLVALGSTTQQRQTTSVHEDVVPVSIRECLDPSIAKSSEDPVEGCLLRKFLRPQKVKNGAYNSMMIVLSHVVRSGTSIAATETETSAMQSVEIKPVIKVSSSSQKCVQEKFARVLGVSPPEDQLSVAVVWWTMADNIRTCALLDGGLEEVLGAAAPMITLVRFPVSSLVTDQKRGYVRVRCSLDDLTVYSSLLRPESGRDGRYPHQQEALNLHFLGGKRFFPGMLNRRAPRKSLDSTGSGRKDHGELLRSPDDSAVPSSTLAEICREICRAIRFQTPETLAPSLVRRIRNASTLGILFCSATAECTKCFAALRDVAAPGRRRDHGTSDGLRSSVPLAGAAPAPSFWHRPRPVPQDPPPPHNGAAAPLPRAEPPATTTPLRCPNQCSPAWAGVKWECSCVLDDGTGQARLLAEREVALALLGLRRDAARRVERGALLDAGGIVFSRGMPPKAYLPGAVRTAQTLARDARRGHGFPGGLRPVAEEDVLRYLTPVAAAEYLLQRHCRSSREPVRGLVYYVRCKPLGDAVHLNQTSVDLHAAGLRDGDAHRRDTATYALPPLKLSLVDCSVEDGPAGDGYD